MAQLSCTFSGSTFRLLSNSEGNHTITRNSRTSTPQETSPESSALCTNVSVCLIKFTSCFSRLLSHTYTTDDPNAVPLLSTDHGPPTSWSNRSNNTEAPSTFLPSHLPTFLYSTRSCSPSNRIIRGVALLLHKANPPLRVWVPFPTVSSGI